MMQQNKIGHYASHPIPSPSLSPRPIPSHPIPGHIQPDLEHPRDDSRTHSPHTNTIYISITGQQSPSPNPSNASSHEPSQNNNI
ncbi:hypothetical protein K505DRAFT_329352 [Melanomma pulvis-pyrius CBS 109.77]|uniref:Uncharacterized protein n=1 Tax=Melanomma pulvis-pyrius CBS 109.77 TaxID=1314802 RepID=A0A6A6WUV4_9PLEO|nr:hypothetical protein K505DRAFT_329352 [Melanomma pulvis-pyrius CBS 109.77]